MMKLWGQSNSNDCGPIAVYNLARILDLPSIYGGYRAHQARLRRGCGYDRVEGCTTPAIVEAVRAELAKNNLTLVKRRPNWGNILRQLDRAPTGGRKPIGLLTYHVGDGEGHVVPLYMNASGLGVWAATTTRGVADRRATSLFMAEGDGAWWPTHRAPTDDNVLGFWQVVRDQS